MAEKYDVRAIMNDLKAKEEMDPDKHDGCYELMRETIEAYSKLNDFSALDYKDLDLIYLTTVGTWRQGIESKKKLVNDCHLMPEDKEYLSMLWDEVWEKAGRGEYSNNELAAADGRSIGLFGTGFFSFNRTTTKMHALAFIKMCVDILPINDDAEMFDRATKTLTASFQGMRAASASMILHCIKPFSFPILNANTGFTNVFEVLGVQLVKPNALETYVENCRRIKDFRDQNFTCKNYRIYDIESQNLDKFHIKHEYGKFDSWEIIDENVAKKNCDKSFFAWHGSGIPQAIRWFFEVEELQPGDRKNLTLIYDGSEYGAYIQRESITLARTRIFWDTSLAALFAPYSDDGKQHILSFHREGDQRYSIHFGEASAVKAWLLTWNKDKWVWENYEKICEDTKAGKPYPEGWSCANKNPQIGDEVFLIKLGEKPRGIIAHGRVIRPQYITSHFDSAMVEEGKTEKAIDVEFDRILDYEKEEIVSQDELKQKCPDQFWSPQGSGIEIKPEALPILHEMWDAVTKEEKYGLTKIASFLKEFAGEHYRAPEKAGDQAEYMTQMKSRGQEARQLFIDFIKDAIEDIPDLNFVSCSNWLNQGQVVQRYFWIELKKQEWMGYPNSVSVSIEKNEKAFGNEIGITVRSETKDNASTDEDYNRQFRLLDCDLSEKMTYLIKDRKGELHYYETDIDKVRELCDKGAVLKLEVIEVIKKLTRNENTILSETGKAIKEIYPLYAYVMGEEMAPEEEEWWPSLSEYDPGITAEEYKRFFTTESIVKRTWLEALYELYKMPDHAASCKQLSDQYGYAPSHYISYFSSAGQNIQKETGVRSPEDDKNAKCWPILFQGKSTQDGYCYKMRKPVTEAIEMLIEEGVFTTAGKENMIQFDHNMILYGPPGTGKTYNTVYYAVAICEGKPFEEVREENYSDVLERYNKLRREERILFTTFHQSYGYEEFIEGIRPVMANDENSGELEYVITDGIFKSICNAARTPEGIAVNHNASIWFVRLKDSGDNELKRECFNDGEIRFDGPENPEDGFSWEYERISKMKPGDYVLSYGGKSVYVDGIGVVEDEDLYYDHEKTSYKWTRKVTWLVKNKLIDVREINGNYYLPNFVIAAMSHMKLSDLLHVVEQNGGKGFHENTKNYVIIIDEINRGNISKIFGELITLIEDTKRAGAEEEMEAVLPYSGESFSVPSNVYILGTMNTADRSIALMDTALRRRFEFVEMMPEPKVLEKLEIGTITVDGEELNVAKMLTIINERIEYLFDREHTIGHAFFTKLKDDPSIDTLANIFKKNVIPLLQEYFYEDYEKIQLVLGDNEKEDEYKFILDKKVELKQIFKGNPDIDLPSKGYSIQKTAFKKLQSYKQIGKDL